MIEIEHGIPIPNKKKPDPYKEIPWSKLQIGDSFVFKHTNVSALKLRARKHGIEIVIQALNYKRGIPPTEYRVWRVK
jgi:hypothetical protein